jgi:hypothetical protein
VRRAAAARGIPWPIAGSQLTDELLGVPEVVAALLAEYTDEGQQYLPDADPDFDVVYAIRAQSAMMWRLADYEASQLRWTS